jgi:hypothetical protein
MLTRRAFVAGVSVARLGAETDPRYRVGITTNTRGGHLPPKESARISKNYIESKRGINV